jgi:neutral ceramidase
VATRSSMRELSDPRHGACALRASAARAPIGLPDALFPTEGLLGVHDTLHARVLLLDSGQRVALVSVELTSLPEEQVTLLREAVGQNAGLPAENVWMCVTHTLSAPHFVPEKMCKTSADRQKNGQLSAALFAAVRDASLRASARLAPARLGHGSGPCDVNVNRDVWTSDGWWLGRDEVGFSDKTLAVLRFETSYGSPIALLFCHPVRPAVTERPPGSDEPGLVTADLAGAASALVEQEYGGEVTALFFMGAAGDQAPALADEGSWSTAKDRGVPPENAGNRAHALAESIGARLGAEVVRLSNSIKCQPCAVPIVVDRAQVELAGQEMIQTQLLRPSKRLVFASGQPRSEQVEVVRIGDIALVGVRPELSCRTGVDIRQRSPLPATLVLTMVNGAAKYMAEDLAYERITYEAMNSPFARGSAEVLADKAVGLLQDMSG